LSIYNEKYKKLNDIELCLLFQKKKSRRVVNELFRRYNYLIRTVCWKYLGKEDCKDVASEVFEKFLNQLEYKIPNNIGAWLYTVSKNTCLQQLRQNRTVINIDTFEIASELNSDNKEELLSFIEQALSKIKPEQKQCIELFYLHELTYEKIVKKTGSSLKSVKSCLQNGRRNILIYINKNLKKA